MKVLMIDNYDSFTYNLVNYLQILGAQVTVVRNDQIKVEDVPSFEPDAIVISPGPCTPREAGISVEVIKSYYTKYPILGVCLGHQAIGYAFGANIVRAKRLMHGKTSLIYHEGVGILEGLPNPFVAVRYHSLVIAEDSLPSFLKVTARSDDGEVMAIQHTDYPVFGVQFHPESVMSEAGLDLLKNFLKITEETRLSS
ncbi:glutamine amidotransferase of anthranilate synthase [Thermocrinis albus DSM 14484]|uniref:Glutamine amidotransferase of anthranilate synthase n=1 Tax=Thermocrinis albus (strain DSM 14484 / JCM 11386 / HI 11/12) TaxID=638303 RepID=D3SL88_THEAH|nr:aminodeoxychorismate/anthranilate synthase component II [Thermocrinis albus]ADC89518.1 glutamine amidotransferase of anthranilate synthase [Thermocrinis albus DSM 14484]